jgi:hypothetical protein
MRSEHTAMPGDQRTLFVNEHRVGETKFADRCGDLRYLLVGMSASIASVGDQPIDRPALDLVRRPRLLIYVGISRAGRTEKKRLFSTV